MKSRAAFSVRCLDIGPNSFFYNNFQLDENFVRLMELYNFDNYTTVVLAWQIQSFVVILCPGSELQQNEISMELELLVQSVSTMGH